MTGQKHQGTQHCSLCSESSALHLSRRAVCEGIPLTPLNPHACGRTSLAEILTELCELMGVLPKTGSAFDRSCWERRKQALPEAAEDARASRRSLVGPPGIHWFCAGEIDPRPRDREAARAVL